MREFLLVETPADHPGPRWTALMKESLCVSGVGATQEEAIASIKEAIRDYEVQADLHGWEPFAPWDGRLSITVLGPTGPLSVEMNPQTMPGMASSLSHAVA